jgi:hypothetical protein
MANQAYNLTDLTGPISAVGARVLRCIEQQMVLGANKGSTATTLRWRVFDPIAHAVWDNTWLALRHLHRSDGSAGGCVCLGAVVGNRVWDGVWLPVWTQITQDEDGNG